MKAVTWRDVVRALPDTETRSYAVTLFRGSGFTVDSFDSKTKARGALANALTRTEDWLETNRRGGREAIQTIRRQLECELWP